MADFDDEDAEDSNDSTEMDAANAESEESDNEMDADDGESESKEEDERDEEQDAKDLARLQQQVVASPYDYDAYVQLIQLARICGELDVLRFARQKMSEMFPLTETLWKAWLEDEAKPGILDKTNPSEIAKIDALFERAVTDYISVDLWLDYAMFKPMEFSEEAIQQVRAIFERAITAVGLHVPQGILLWTSYREIEEGYLATLVPALGEIQTPEMLRKYEKQVERVKELFKRQISVPLIGMDDTLTEYRNFTGQEIEPTIQKLFDKSKAKLNDVLPFEQKLEAASDREKYGIFIAYIEHEKEPIRARLLYERALVPYCLSVDLWNKYLDFLDRQLKNPDISLAAHERSIRNLPWTIDLWLSYLRAVEHFGKEQSVVKDIFDRAMRTGCTLPSHHVDLWLAYLSYLKRQIPVKPPGKSAGETSTTPEIEALRKKFDEAVKDLEIKGADQANKVERFFASVEAITFHDVAAGRALWDKVMKSHQRGSEFWLAYYRFERLFGDAARCRKVLKKAVLINLDNNEVVAMEWMQFELEMGSLTDYVEASRFCKDSIKRVAERQAKLDKAALIEAEKQAAPKKNFRLRDSYEDNREDGRDRPRRDRDRERPERFQDDSQNNKQNADKRKRSNEEPAGMDHDGFKVPALPGMPAPPKKQKVADAPVDEANRIAFSTKSPEGNKEERTVFLSNLGYNTTERAIFDLFHTVGGIVAIRVVKDLRGKSRGFCYVEYDSVGAIPEALKLDRRDLEGRPVFVAKDSKDQRESHYKGTGGEEKNKLFIRGLQTRVTKDDLAQIFQEYGALKEVRIVTHKNGISKGIAYVEFADPDTAKKAMEGTNGKEILGKPMIVAISNPPAFTPKQRPDMTNFDPSKEFRPVVLPPPEGQRKSRSHVDLVPRALLKKQADAEFSAPPVPIVSQTQNNPAAVASVKKSNDEFRALFKKK